MKDLKIHQYYEMASLQIAAEALLESVLTTADVKAALKNGNESLSILPDAAIENYGFDSNSRYQLIAYQDMSLRSPEPAGATTGLESGFAASLFYDTKENEYTLSFRSTEFDETIRDAGDIEADGEIALFGWAFSQIHSMEEFWDFLVGGASPVAGFNNVPSAARLNDFRNAIATGAQINVTGYSLGANLATAFTELHSDVVSNAFLFNGAGTGSILGSIDLGTVWSSYRSIFNLSNSSDPYYAVPLNIAAISAAEEAASGQLLDDSALAVNPRHWRGLVAVAPHVVGAPLAQLLSVFDAQRETQGYNAKIYDIWSKDQDNGGFLESVVASAGIRHGAATPIWYEYQGVVSFGTLGDGWFDWGTGHSIVLLYDSLALMAVMEQIDPSIQTEALGKIFNVASNMDYSSLESAANALARLVGVTGLSAAEIADDDLDFSDMDLRNALHNLLQSVQETPFFQSLVAQDGSTGLIPQRAGIEIADSISAFDSVRTDFAQFLSLYHLSPFSVSLLDETLKGELLVAHGDVGTDWDADRNMTPEERSSGLANFSDQYIADRILFLSALLERNRKDSVSGNSLTLIEEFSDATQNIAFNAFQQSYGGPPRAQLAFGSETGEVNQLPTSDFGDRVYGMGGSDTISGGAGRDYLEGGAGEDVLLGGVDEDQLLGGADSDVLNGGEGNDTLLGGAGSDRFVWEDGGGSDTIIDGDTGEDRILVNGIDLSSLTYVETAPYSDVYVSSGFPGLELLYNGAQLLVSIDGPGGGSIYVNKFEPVHDKNFGIVLGGHVQRVPVTNYAVSELGNQTGQTPADAELRDFYFPQQDWASTHIFFNADEVSNFAGAIGGQPFVYADSFLGGLAVDHIVGDLGANRLEGLSGDDLIEGAGGSDLLIGGGGADYIYGGDGEDYIWGGGRVGGTYSSFYQPLVFDNPGDVNTLDGGQGIDRISGGRYGDRISGGEGADFLWGGTGSDTIEGGAEGDVIYGDSNMEYRLEDQGTIVVIKQNSWAEGVDSSLQYSDRLSGGNGNDTIWGEQGDDVLFGGSGADILYGDRVTHTFYQEDWGSTNSHLDAQYHGNDFLFGGDGSDFLWGNAGEDFLSGGADTDVLDGGPGDDIYHYASGDGVNFVTDEQGLHTLFFADVAIEALGAYHFRDLEFPYQEWVVVGTSRRAGVQIARSEWDNVEIAVGTPDNIVERSRIDTHFLSEHTSSTVASVAGVYGLSEAQRDELIAINDVSPTVPEFSLSSLIENAVVSPTGHPSQLKAQLSFSSQAFGPEFDFDIVLNQGLLDHVFFEGDGELLFSGFSGVINGTETNDRVVASEGNDEIVTGLGDDVLVGGGGADLLDGGVGFDTYVFFAGDGVDTVIDAFGNTRLEFNDIDESALALHFTANTESDFRIEYSTTDALTSMAGLDIDQVTEVVVNGELVPLTIRSEILDGDFRGTRGDDVFETGGGSDTIYADGKGSDIYRFSAGDGSDTISSLFDTGSTQARPGRGEIRFQDASEALSFSFSNSHATIGYGSGDEVSIVPNTVRDTLENALFYYSLSSDSDPLWIPEIQAGISANVYGSLGADHILGSIGDDTILPGYGDDLIEAGQGDDTIHLDRFYFDKGVGGIGHKTLRGGEGNDTIHTPLAQGMIYRFGLGDGHDQIVYNWSTTSDYELSGTGIAPYDIDAVSLAELTFTPHGADTLVLEDGIELDDLHFQRIGDGLRISINGGQDSIRIENYFVSDPPDGPVDLSEIDTGGKVIHSLEVLVAQGALPENPLRIIRVGGQTLDLPSLLTEQLELITLSQAEAIMGTEAGEVLVGGAGNHQIYSFDGDDTITDTSGENYIDAGAGDDEVTIGGQTTLDAGPGDDIVNIGGGINTIRLGGGSDNLAAVGGSSTIILGEGGGNDRALIDTALGDVSVQLADGVSLSDISIETVTTLELGLSAPGYPSEQALKLTVATTGETLSLVRVDLLAGFQFRSGVAINELVISGALAVSGAQLWDVATTNPHQTLEGTAAADLLIGTSGNDVFTGSAGDDVLYGMQGDDIFTVSAGQGVDRFYGGAGFDTLRLESGTSFTTESILPSDGIELITADLNFNIILGTDDTNVFDLSATTVENFFGVAAGAGDDVIVSSDAPLELLAAGAGSDVVTGGSGQDVYFLVGGDGTDVFNHYNTDAVADDSIAMLYINHENLWFSRDGATDDLLIDVVGTDDQFRFTDWFAGDQYKVKQVAEGEHTLSGAGVQTLVQAMSVYDIPLGAGAVMPAEVRQVLDPIISSVWQSQAA